MPRQPRRKPAYRTGMPCWPTAGNIYRIVVLVIVLIVHGSLYPWQFRGPAEPVHPISALLHAWQPITDRRLILDAAGNVFFYVPLGLALFFALARRRPAGLSAAIAMLGAAALSASLEMAQLFTPSQHTSASDLLLNVAGAAIGVALAATFRGRLRPIALHGQEAGAAPAAVILGCWIARQLLPLGPGDRPAGTPGKGPCAAPSGRLRVDPGGRGLRGMAGHRPSGEPDCRSPARPTGALPASSGAGGQTAHGGPNGDVAGVDRGRRGARAAPAPSRIGVRAAPARWGGDSARSGTLICTPRSRMSGRSLKR